jgi:hypothetical protein
MGLAANAARLLLLFSALAVAAAAAPVPVTRARLGFDAADTSKLQVNVSGDVAAVRESSLTLDITLDTEQSCDGVSSTAAGTALLRGDVAGAFTLANTSAIVLVHCGGKGIDVAVVAEGVPLEVTRITGGESKTVVGFSMRASVYDGGDGEDSLAGSLQLGEDTGDTWWFDSCAGSFEVRHGLPQHPFCLDGGIYDSVS